MNYPKKPIIAVENKVSTGTLLTLTGMAVSVVAFIVLSDDKATDNVAAIERLERTLTLVVDKLEREIDNDLDEVQETVSRVDNKVDTVLTQQVAMEVRMERVEEDQRDLELRLRAVGGR